MASVTDHRSDKDHTPGGEQRCAKTQHRERIASADPFGQRRERGCQQREAGRLDEVEIPIGDRTMDEPDSRSDPDGDVGRDPEEEAGPAQLK